MTLTKQQLYWVLNGLSLLFLCLSACDTPTPYGDLELLVLDDDGQLIENARVSLFLTREDYELEQNAINEADSTDEDGSLQFFNLLNTTYFVNVVRGNLNNWEGNVEIQLRQTENGFNNSEIIVIKNSKSGILANVEGKSWEIEQILVGNIDVTNDPDFICSVDDQLTFFKNSVLLEDEGLEKCDDTAPQTVEGTWRINEAETAIIIERTDSEGSDEANTIELSIISISEDALRLVVFIQQTFADITYVPAAP